MDKIIYRLKKKYFLFLLPIIIYILLDSILFFIQKSNLRFRIENNRFLITIFLIGAALFDILLPMWNKIMFINLIKKSEEMEKNKSYFNYQKKLLYFSFSGGYLAIIAYAISLPEIPLFLILLGGIYSLYFYYPSKKRIYFDKKMLNIGLNEKNNK